MLTRPQRLQRRIMQRVVPLMASWQLKKEATVLDRPGVTKAGPTSPERVDIIGRSICVAVRPFNNVGDVRLHASMLACGHHQSVQRHVTVTES